MRVTGRSLGLDGETEGTVGPDGPSLATCDWGPSSPEQLRGGLVGLFSKSDEAVRSDPEPQAWCTEVLRPGSRASWAGVRHRPLPTDLSQLAPRWEPTLRTFSLPHRTASLRTPRIALNSPDTLTYTPASPDPSSVPLWSGASSGPDTLPLGVSLTLSYPLPIARFSTVHKQQSAHHV